MPDVRIEGVEKRFGDVAVLNAISVVIPDRSLVTLLGPSGCGKTTLLRLIAGLDHASGGRIAIGERLVSEPTRRIHVPAAQRRIGMVFQSYALWPNMSIAENVAHPLRVRRVARAERQDRVATALNLVQLSHLAERYPGELSGGQQQRVALARAIVYEPDLLLLDEPLSNLDAKLRTEMRHEIRELQRRCGLTSVYVTHDQEEAFAVSDLICVMNHGVVEQIGTGIDLYLNPSTHFVGGFVGAAVCLAGEVSALIDAATAAVVVGGVWPVTARCNRPLSVRDPVELIIRPHDISLSGSPGQPGAALAQILDVTYLGSTTEYRCRIADLELLVRENGTPRFATGQSVSAGIEPRRCIAIPRQ